MSAPAFLVPQLPPLDSTYGAWLVSLFVETILYGMGVLQTWIYFASVGWPQDSLSIRLMVCIVVVLETLQVTFFFRSSYLRFVQNFGVLTAEIDWVDSAQLLSSYLGAFAVRLFFASRVYKLTQKSPSPFAKIGMYGIFVFAFLSVVAGSAQTAWTSIIGSFLKLNDTKAVTTVQAATSLTCDLLITLFLCIFLTRQKGDIKKTNIMMERLIYEAINRGTLTVLASGINLILFLALPDTFWFFLGLAPSSKLYMNSLLATLNNRQRIRDQVASRLDKGWNPIPMGSMGHTIGGRSMRPLKFKAHGNDTKSNFDGDISIIDGMRNKSIEVICENEAMGVQVVVQRQAPV
ncbi:hypothetical protein MIND_01131700 [Mycena indigotica]|uniref:DUF6534 domain-containing protein n=1 Tax=Mycena indigotica TaxID=2126181 RepID=A0A8H6S681_9AGAR|nr:uncharacterized protein MIND_01131700 [Mycena indigotica]KAF7293533.1 hypothetical protein MIND_01131700 [Mycena indigotica]